MARNYLLDLKDIKSPGEQLVGDDETLSTEFGTLFGRRMVINTLVLEQLIIVDRLEPGTIEMMEKGAELNSFDLLIGSSNVEITPELIVTELQEMVEVRATDNHEQVAAALEAETSIDRDDLLRAIIRICEKSDAFEEKYLSSLQTVHDVWFNQGANSDGATIRKMLCPDCFVMLPMSGGCNCK